MSFQNIWTERYRPKTSKDILISESLISTFDTYRKTGEIPNLLFLGQPGTGKTSLSRLIVNDILQCQYLYINSSDENGIDTIRTKVSSFAQTKSIDGKIKVIILDEADGISAEGQRALRNTMEEFASITRFILTGNYKHKIIEPLQSRCQSFDISPSIKQCLVRCFDILKKENVLIPAEQQGLLAELVKSNYPDLRLIINEIQKYSTSGTLSIQNNQIHGLISEIYQMVKEKELSKLRKYLIESEQKFNADYQNILRSLFNYIDKNEVNPHYKKYCLLIIAEYIWRNTMVVDQELNSYACMITLCEYKE